MVPFTGVIITLITLFGALASYFYTGETYMETEPGVNLYTNTIGTGEDLFIVHGGPGFSHDYLMPHLIPLANDLKLHFFDQRGCGKSLIETIDRTTINLETLTLDIEKLRVEKGLEKISLLGHSWGGILSLHYALRYPEHVDKLILVASPPLFKKGLEAFKITLNERAKDMFAELSPIMNADTIKELSPEKVCFLTQKFFSTFTYLPEDAYKIDFLYSSAAASAGVLIRSILEEDVIYDPKDTLEKAKTLNIKTLVLHGREDIDPLWAAKKTALALPGGQLKVIEECGHFPFIEKPEEFLNAVRDFMLPIETIEGTPLS